MKFTIQRSRWYRGDGGMDSKLVRGDGTMCCLGFLGEACGLPTEVMRDLSTPDAMSKEYRVLWPSGILDTHGIDTLTTHKLVTANDARGMPDGVREEELTALFKTIHIDVEFVP